MKQFSPNEVTDEGILIDVKLLQSSKHILPNELTNEGISMDVKPLQSAKQQLPNEVIDEGSSMEVKPLQPLYLEVIDSQLFAVNTVEKWIGFYLWVHGKWRFNDFNLLLRANVRFGWQNEGREEK